MLLLKPGNNDPDSKLTSVLTILYEHENDKPNDKLDALDWEINILQRGYIQNPQQLLPMKEPNEDLENYNGVCNDFISRTTTENYKGRLEFLNKNNGEIKAKYEGTSKTLKTEKILNVSEWKDLEKAKENLIEKTPFSIINVKGRKNNDGLCVFRLVYDIRGEIEERDTVENCPYFDNIRYSILTPKRVYEYLFSKEKIEKKINATANKNNQSTLDSLVKLFYKDLEIASNSCPLLCHDIDEVKEKKMYKFDLLIVGMDDDRFRYTVGYDAGISIHNMGNKVNYELKKGNKGTATLFYAFSENAYDNVYFPLLVEKKAPSDVICKQVISKDTIEEIVNEALKKDILKDIIRQTIKETNSE